MTDMVPSCPLVAKSKMIKPEQSTIEQEALQREAYQWVMRLTSGDATKADAEALNRWRQTSQAHRRAFAEANLLWEKLRPVAAEAAARTPPLASQPHPVLVNSPKVSNRLIGRRAFLGGALAASAAAVGYVAVQPPFNLLPSLGEMTADYRTGVGQQQQITLQDNVSVQLNTRTSIALLSPEKSEGKGQDQANRIELISGEAAVATRSQILKPFTVVAAQGRTVATNARFNVRHDGATICVTCLEGDLRVEHLGQVLRVPMRQQIVYDATGLGTATNADPDMVTAWQRGLLVFRNDPLAHVIDEVNRYRPGKIILINADLGRRPVLATFRIDRIEEVVPRLQAVFSVQVRNLPGGIVLVS